MLRVETVGMSSIMVPDNFSLQKAIKYANKHIKEISIPKHLEPINNSIKIDKHNSNFKGDI